MDFYDFELQGPVNYSDPGKFEYEMSVEDLTGSSQKKPQSIELRTFRNRARH